MDDTWKDQPKVVFIVLAQIGSKTPSIFSAHTRGYRAVLRVSRFILEHSELGLELSISKSPCVVLCCTNAETRDYLKIVRLGLED